MRIKKIKFGNDPTLHFVVGLDLNRIELTLYAKNPKTMINESKISKDFYIVGDSVILDDELDDNFIRESEVVIVDLIYNIYNEYVGLQEVENKIWNAQLENTGYIEFEADVESEENN